MKIIIGLGNPGDQYGRTRHNLGFRVVDMLAGQADIKLARSRYFKAYAGKGVIGDEPVMLAKPLTYMNNSGQAVKSIVDYTKAPLEKLLVVCDDFQIPHGKLRIRRQGSSGGHNGLESIIGLLGGEQFSRLRIGLGGPAGADPKKFVLGNFTRAEEKLNKEILDRAVQAVQCWLKDGIEKAMTRFN